MTGATARGKMIDPKRCNVCDRSRVLKRNNGLCTEMAEDGLPIRCVADHSEKKLCIVEAYIDIFSKAMKNKKFRNYIDLFAGPGLCYNSDQKREILGSPLLALNSPIPFTSIHLVELNPIVLDILKQRVSSHTHRNIVHFYAGDCNEKIIEVIEHLPQEWSLSVAFIDPEGFELKFATLKQLAEGRRLDLIVNFPTSGVLRNIKRERRKERSRLDDLVPGWRQKIPPVIEDPQQAILELLDLFKQKLKGLGYREFKDENQISIHSSSTQVKLYDLIFASKSPLGEKFWKAVARKAAQRLQRTLF